MGDVPDFYRVLIPQKMTGWFWLKDVNPLELYAALLRDGIEAPELLGADAVGVQVLEEVYAFSPAPGTVERPSAAARDELLMLLVFAPLLVADIRSPVSISVTACDASPWVCAGVAAELSERTADRVGAVAIPRSPRRLCALRDGFGSPGPGHYVV